MATDKMTLKLLFSLVLCTAICLAEDPEEKMTVPEIIKFWGYPAETYATITQDGYVLTMHRIPYGKAGRGKSNRPVAFLQHGLLCSSSNWVTNLPEQSLAFMLADAGYDVWMGNVRGNTYSTAHVEYARNDSRYWAFSWDEMAKYDLPAMINHALFISGQKSLYYVGHSQGTMMAFSGLSMNKELADKVNIFFALAPVAKVAHTKSPIRYLAYFTPLIKIMFGELGVEDFMPSTKLVQWLAEKMCPEEATVCDNILFLLSGYDISNLNKTRVPVYFSHTPAGTSVQNILHYGQMILSQKFQAYDYGTEKNLVKYGKTSPRQYSLKDLKTPVYAYSGGQDWLADPQDVKWLMSQVPHLIKHRMIAKYNHLDFIWGEDAHSKVYHSIIRTMAKYERQKQGEIKHKKRNGN
ncbi:lysosomal acid lipase/cholesteryl ester hydrolase-like [Rhopilema esculentum]|uniref:lysosomal acid lipase/cholesteryl ester hydrolase-like n=1 Tax=Rhopilema esculentum TaxID=499914 RepID=UPI0031D6E5F8|eukprot:gene8496-14496_t